MIKRKVLSFSIAIILGAYTTAMEINQIDAKNSIGYTQLMQAAMNGNYNKAATLVKAGANLNLQNPDGETALMLAAAYYTDSGIAQLLINSGANVNLVANDGKTALHRAAGRSFEIVEALLKAGATPHFPDNAGNTPRKRALAHLKERKNDKELLSIIKLLEEWEKKNPLLISVTE